MPYWRFLHSKDSLSKPLPKLLSCNLKIINAFQEISQAFCGDIDIWKGTGSGLRVKRWMTRLMHTIEPVGSLAKWTGTRLLKSYRFDLSSGIFLLASSEKTTALFSCESLRVRLTTTFSPSHRMGVWCTIKLFDNQTTLTWSEILTFRICRR